MTTLTMIQRNDLVLSHLILAERIARKKSRQIRFVDYDELESAAYLGLVEAANNYNPDKNDCFAAFAIQRVVGAILDYLRELGWGPRSKPAKAIIMSEEYLV